jgi:hypothetical protein
VNTAAAGNLDFTLAGKFWPASETPLNADVALGKRAAAGRKLLFKPLNVPVPGMLNLNGTGTWTRADGTVYKGDLARYFLGGEMTTNVGDKAAKVNFIDIGPQPFATGPTYQHSPTELVSKQYLMIQHLYQIFSQLLGCSLGFPQYEGVPGMWTKHRFMELTDAQNMYFVTQVGAAAKSYGVVDADITIIATALINLYNRKNSPAVAVNAAAGLTSSLQSICQGPTCTESSKGSGGEPTPEAYAEAKAQSADGSTAASSAVNYLFQPYAYLFTTIVAGLFLF